MIYPNSTPEFRILVKSNGAQILQVRYISITHGYTGKWKNVPFVQEAVE